MADTKVNVVENSEVETQTQVQQEEPKKEKSQLNDKELVNSLKDEIKNELSSFYMEKIDVLKKQLQGQDKKNSELTKKLNAYEREKLTETEKFELEKREMEEAWQKLYRERAIAKYNLIPSEDDEIDIKDYLYGSNEEEVYQKAEKIKMYIDKRINQGIENGVEERLAQGYRPQGSGISGQKDNDITRMSKDDLAEYTRKVAKMPSGDEKDKILEELMQEQQKRFKGE